MTQLNPRKLLNSKWTAVTPRHKEKHFMVTELEFNEDGTVLRCEIEAVMSKRCEDICWRNLKDASQWRQGWK